MKRSPFSPSSRSRGIALVVVLSMLVILSGVLVAFFSMAMTERASSEANSNGSTARQLSDSTVNFVIAQLREATTPADDAVTWSSQPGAIRTFSGRIDGRATLPEGVTASTYQAGDKDFVYKLYSAERMKASASEYDKTELPKETAVIEQWNRQNPLPGYTDLNEPAFSARPDLGTGIVEPHYPIIDPRAKYTNDGQTPNATPNPGIVEGFDVKTTGLTDDHLQLPGGGRVPYLPMPVQWLYVFRDGSVGKLSDATKANPVVGRTAFWVDDESCKLNINTASEGTFWDTPTASTERESGAVSTDGTLTSSSESWSFGSSQPSRGEYQRYPGHPATTCLSPALGWIWRLTPSTPLQPRASADYLRFKEAIYQMAPFMPYGVGTSMGATRNPDLDAPFSGDPKLRVTRKHLYTNPDGLLFTSRRFNGENPELNSQLNPRLTPDALEKVEFFLTANSRAPETNLLGRPRVTIWPVNADTTRRTHFDDLFAFTSTLGPAGSGRGYYFSRLEAKDASYDFNSIPRNRELRDYLKWATDRDVPGFGGSFGRDKYKFAVNGVTERDQILTEIFDYTRTVNLVDTGTRRAGQGGFQPYTPFFGNGQAGYGSISERSFDWSGQVTPIKIGATAGLGRFATVSEAALMFYRAGNVPSTPVNGSRKQQGMQAILLLEMATPMAGYPAIRETYWTRVTCVPTTAGVPATVTVNGQSVPLNLCANGASPRAMINIPNVSAHEVSFGRGFMPTLGVAAPLHYYPEHKGTTDPAKYPNDPNRVTTTTLNLKNFVNTNPANLDGGYKRFVTVTNYPYVSDIIPIGPATEFTMSDATFTVEIFSGETPEDKRSQLVQKLTLTFPRVTLQTPDGEEGNDVSFGTRFTQRPINKDNNWNIFIRSYDTIRSVELTGARADGSPLAGPQAGDVRLVMARADVPNGAYQPRGGPTMYANKTIRQVHGLTSSHGDPLPGYWPGDAGAGGNPTRGRLATGAVNRGSKPPILPANINGVRRADGGPGDWDRGMSKHLDGALGNKVDEGNVYFNYKDGSAGGRMPYFRGRGIEEVGQSFFTPNRQMASAVMFGSLPTGVLEGKPWQTLLFRPDRETGPGHPGGRTPPDHLLLDLFHLPVVEPYAISEPFSTAGKVNLNYVIAPFGYAKGDSGVNPGTTNPRSYIRRDTALRGVLKSVKVMAVRTNEKEGLHAEDPMTSQSVVRYDIDLDKTLQHLETRFKDSRRGLFRSASEICDVDLYPKGLSVGSWSRFWDVDYALTGDNMRERPYAHIYPRVTTKSNVFTVHMRCQTIRKSPKAKPDEFDETKDAVVAEYRGSATIERFIDPNDANLRGYNEISQRMEPYYRFRIISTKHFAPQ